MKSNYNKCESAAGELVKEKNTRAPFLVQVHSLATAKKTSRASMLHHHSIKIKGFFKKHKSLSLILEM